MATYVFSDVHGHCGTLDRLLEKVSPASDDAIYMLGDMIDRGPDPVGVIRVCMGLPNCHILKGNHEDLMLDFIHHPHDELAEYNWSINGGYTTVEGLTAFTGPELGALVEWLDNLPRWEVVTVGERPYVLVHAGILPTSDMPTGTTDEEVLKEMLAAQSEEDLSWIREDFWGQPTGLIDENGQGAIVIAGHTPTPYLSHMADLPHRSALNDKGLAQMVRVGACEATGGVADRWNIDCGCAGGAGYGQLLMLRLDDEQEFYEPVQDGE